MSEMLVSKVGLLYEKMYFCPQKMLFEHVFVNCKIIMASFKQFFLFCNLFSESRKAAQKKALLFCSYQRYVQKAFLGAKLHIFVR